MLLSIWRLRKHHSSVKSQTQICLILWLLIHMQIFPLFGQLVMCFVIYCIYCMMNQGQVLLWPQTMALTPLELLLLAAFLTCVQMRRWSKMFDNPYVYNMNLTYNVLIVLSLMLLPSWKQGCLLTRLVLHHSVLNQLLCLIPIEAHPTLFKPTLLTITNTLFSLLFSPSALQTFLNQMLKGCSGR